MREKEVYEKGYRINKQGDVMGIRAKTLLPHLSRRGYHTFSYKRKKASSASLMMYHRFQAYTKYGDKIFDKGIIVRHLDGNPLNNHWDNIAIGNQSDNMMDKTPEQRKKDASNPKYDHIAILNDRDDGMTYKEIMKKYDISSKGTVSFIINKSIAQE